MSQIFFKMYFSYCTGDLFNKCFCLSERFFAEKSNCLIIITLGQHFCFSPNVNILQIADIFWPTTVSADNNPNRISYVIRTFSIKSSEVHDIS